jgi:hypothetical protein
LPLKPDVLAGWPPQGWTFFEPATNWVAPMPLQNTFREQVQNIINMRLANPRFKLATDYLSVAQDLANYTEKRLKNHPKYVIQAGGGAVAEAQKKTTSPLSNLQSEGEDAVAGDHVDPAALVEWLGSGGRAVERELAETRASICATCPENSESPTCDPARRLSWREWWTKPVAFGLQKLLSIRNGMKMETSRDAELGKCLACKCELPLKVWVPVAHVLDNASAEDLAKLDERCWVLHERGEQQ